MNGPSYARTIPVTVRIGYWLVAESFDRAMPEEHNRVMTDALADRCFAPHPSNERRLRSEGIGPPTISPGVTERTTSRLPAAHCSRR
ncbi:MAG: hypothetical protein ABIO83_09415 [Ilumatobacteraceae bacterium]